MSTKMRLQSLRLVNFKSYAGEHIVGPFDKMTAVIGANASGKSNLFDAITFVLGASASKMRCSDLSKLICKSDKSATSASVDMILEDKDQKNRIFSRTITYSGSRYNVDGKTFTATAYKEALASVGFHQRMSAYVVFQGDIHTMALMKPNELTSLIDDLSGSSLYKDQYDESEKKLDSQMKKIQVMEEKRESLIDRKDDLKILTKIATEWRDNEKQLNNEENQIKMFHIYHYANEEKKYDSLKSESAQSFEENTKKNNSLNRSVKESDRLLQSLSKAVKKAEAEERSEQKNVDDANLAQKQSDLKIKQMEAISKENEIRIKGLNDDLKVSKEELIRLRNETADFSKKYNNLIKNESQLQVAFESIQKSNNFETAQNIEKESSHLRFITQSIQEAQMQTESLNRTIEELEKNIPKSDSQLKKSIDKITQDIERTRKRIDESTKALSKKYEERTILKSKSLEGKEVARLNKIISTLQSHTNGVHGLLRELCAPMRGAFERAVAAGLGFRADSILVENGEIASKCAQLCLSLRLGRADFIPLDIESKRTYKHETDGSIPLKDIIRCDDAYKGVIEAVCEGTVFVENPDTAEQLFQIRRYSKIVDIDGVVFRREGVISGGRLKNERGVGNLRTIESNISNLEREINDLKSNLHTLESRENELHREKEEFDNKIKEYNSLLEEKENECRAFKRKIIKLEDEKEKINENLETLKKKISINTSNKDTKLMKEARKVTKTKTNEDFIKVFSDFVEARSENSELMRKISVLELSVGELKNQIVRKKEENERFLKEITDAKASSMESMRKLEEATEGHSRAKELIKTSKNDFETASSQRADLAKRASDAARKAREAERKVSEYNRRACESKSEAEAALSRTIFRTIKEAEEADFGGLSQNLRSEMSDSEFKSTVDKMQRSIDLLNAKLKETTPDFTSEKLLEDVRRQIEGIDDELKEARKQQKSLDITFRDLKQTRCELFNKSLKKITEGISEAYSMLTSTRAHPLGGTAYVTAGSEKMPFATGTYLSVVPPLKRHCSLDSLSGGEQTLAVVALVFALNMAAPAPCFILDEIDAALDARNVRALSAFLAVMAERTQIVLVSHKEEIFSGADSLIGVCSSPGTSTALFMKLAEDQREESDDEPSMVIAGDL